MGLINPGSSGTVPNRIRRRARKRHSVVFSKFITFLNFLEKQSYYTKNPVCWSPDLSER